jgi:hypothetical protein
MFKKFKKIKKNCEILLSSKSEIRSKIEFLENRVKLLEQLNNSLYVVASRSTSAYVDKVLSIQEKNSA